MSGNGRAAASPKRSLVGPGRRRLGIVPPLVRLFWEVDPRRATLLLALTGGLGLVPVAKVHALRRLVETAVQAAGGGRPLGEAVAWGMALSALALLEVAGWQAALTVRNTFGELLRAAIHERVYRHAHAMPLAEFEVPARHDQIQRIRQGLEQRFLLTVLQLFRWVGELVAALSVLLYLVQFHWALPALLFAGTLPGLWVSQREMSWRYRSERRQTADERRCTVMSGVLTGRWAAAELRLFGFGPWFVEQTSRLWQRLMREQLARAARSTRTNLTRDAVNVIALMLTLAFAVRLLAAGRIGLGLAAALFAAVEQFQTNCRFLLNALVTSYADLRYLQEFFEFIDEPAADACAGRRLSGPVTQGIVFDRVSFTYPGGAAPVLREIDLVIRPGERLALVGENGAGKTTLAKLLMGLYQPTEGRILVDGVDLREVSPDDWYRRIGAVFQDFLRFQSTVRENIGADWVERFSDEAAIAAAAAQSGAAEVVAALPQGLDTPLGKEFHDGVDLSVGQWQKLAIARAYVRPAEILILDEPASALDAKAEAAIYDHFGRLAHGKTVLLISHRLGSCRMADRILVLRRGRLMEEGTHAQLLAKGGEYAALYRLQAAWYTADVPTIQPYRARTCFRQ